MIETPQELAAFICALLASQDHIIDGLTVLGSKNAIVADIGTHCYQITVTRRESPQPLTFDPRTN